MFSEAPPHFQASEARSNATDRLNAVPLTGTHMAAALGILAGLPAAERDDPRSQALLLQAYARDTGFGDIAHAGAAIHARATALAKWTAGYDPQRQSGADAVLEAAARHPLVETSLGIGFEPAGFQELVLFIEELPF